MISRRGLPVVLSCLAIACRSVAAGTASHEKHEAPLAARETKAELVAFVGLSPASCVATGRGSELCAWRRIGKTSSAWPELAGSVASDQRLNLLCELPIDGRPRDVGSCTVHPCQAESSSESSGGSSQSAAASARARFAAATDVVALSRLVGDGPERCMSATAGTRLCSWRVTSASSGWGVFALASGIQKRLVLRCELPESGEARAADSCSVDLAR